MTLERTRFGLRRVPDKAREPIDPKVCAHPNLFGCNGHCVWCGTSVVWGPRLVYSTPVNQ